MPKRNVSKIEKREFKKKKKCLQKFLRRRSFGGGGGGVGVGYLKSFSDGLVMLSLLFWGENASARPSPRVFP